MRVHECITSVFIAVINNKVTVILILMSFHLLILFEAGKMHT